jgi:hypothetical protein
MLEEMATVSDESIVSWQPHGMLFQSCDASLF